MYQAKGWPLGFYLSFTPQTKPFEPKVAGDVGEYRLDDPQPLGILVSPLFCVDLLYHPFGVRLVFR